MTEHKPTWWRPPQANRGALLSAGRKISAELLAYATAARAHLVAFDDGDAEPQAKAAYEQKKPCQR